MSMTEVGRNVWVPSRGLYYKDHSLTEEQVRSELDGLRAVIPNDQVSSYLSDGKLTIPGPRYSNLPSSMSVLFRNDIQVFDPPNRHLLKPLETESEERKPSEAGYGADGHIFIARDSREYLFYHNEISPYGTTSWDSKKGPHIHGLGMSKSGIHEYYLKEDGEADIFDGKNIRAMREFEIVPPLTQHFIMERGGKGVRFSIVIGPIDGIPMEYIHLPVDAEVVDLNQLVTSSNNTR